jgi:hypothetical protein
MSDDLDQVKTFLDKLDEAHRDQANRDQIGAARLIVRWTDETRAVPEDESGYTVKRVARATLTARLGGEVVQETFQDVGYEELRDVVAMYPFETLYRSDNVTR